MILKVDTINYMITIKRRTKKYDNYKSVAIILGVFVLLALFAFACYYFNISLTDDYR